MCAIWGTTWLGIKVSVQYVAPSIGAGIRFTIAGLLMYAIAAAAGKIVPPRMVPWKLVIVLAAFLFGLNYILTYVAETHLSSGLTAVLFGVVPFFTFAFAHYLLGEKAGTPTVAGAVVAFCGVAIISYDTGMHGSLWYAAAIIGAALSSAFANVYAKRHSHHDPLVTLPPAMLLAGIVVGAFGVLTEPFDAQRAFAPVSLAAVLYLAVLGSAAAFFLNMWLLARISASIVGLSALIIPVIAVFVGIVFGGEHFESFVK